MPEGDVNALENRLATHAVYDDGNKRLLEQLLTGNEELRKNNASLELENQRLQHTLDLDLRRHKEVAKTEHFSDMYDWIVNIELLSDVSKEVGPLPILHPRAFAAAPAHLPLAACAPSPRPASTLRSRSRPARSPGPAPKRVARRRAQGWRIEFSQTFLQGLDATQVQHLLSGKAWSTSDGKGKPETISWRGAVVAVLGLYDKGKTFVLNNLTDSKLPSGKKVSTKGLSFKHVEVDGGTPFILLDSEGSYAPVKVTDELSVVEKETTELFLQELIFEMSDYFLCVVNDFTSLDQRYLDKLTRNLQNSNKPFREVIVVHNCKEVIDEETLHYVWESQVTAIYGSGTMQSTKVAAHDPLSLELVEKTVGWFKTPFSRHLLLANADSDLGEQMNPWAFSLLRYWLKSVFVPVNRDFSVIDAVVHYSNLKLQNHFKSHPQLMLVQTPEPNVCFVRSCSTQPEQLRLQQLSVDASGIMLTRPDNYLPPVDIIKDNDGSYRVYMDIPGMTRENVKLSRQNVVTIVKGSREPEFTQREMATSVARQERKHGDFTMTFRIPEEFQRKWDECKVENGVMCIT